MPHSQKNRPTDYRRKQMFKHREKTKKFIKDFYPDADESELNEIAAKRSKHKRSCSCHLCQHDEGPKPSEKRELEKMDYMEKHDLNDDKDELEYLGLELREDFL